MALPFTNKYTHTLQGKISPEVYPQVLEYISAFIEKKPVEDIIIEGNTLNFKIGFSDWKWKNMSTIQKGTFELIREDGEVKITYEIFMNRLFISTSIIALFFGIISLNVWVGLGGFLWIFGINLAITIVQHHRIFDKLTSEINDFIYQNNFTDTK